MSGPPNSRHRHARTSRIASPHGSTLQGYGTCDRRAVGYVARTFCARARLITPVCAPEASGPAIEYETVAAARLALASKAGVVFTTVNDWEIGTDEAALTMWSFSPPDYPAYPAVVKRQVVEDGGQVFITMSVHCEASKLACDDLVRTFSRTNGFELPE